MKSRIKRMKVDKKFDGGRFQLIGYRNRRIKPAPASLAQKWRDAFRRRQKHDPMLVLNMTTFNFAGGWSRIFNPLKAHENGTP